MPPRNRKTPLFISHYLDGEVDVWINQSLLTQPAPLLISPVIGHIATP